ncbi:MAG: hypothetical protein AAGB00_11260 [Planctomycetota bacterium]
MDRLLRITALAVSGATLLWVAGCDARPPLPKKPGGGGAVVPAKPAPPADAAPQLPPLPAPRSAAPGVAVVSADEGPTPITKDDYKRGSKLKSSRFNRALGGALAAGEGVQLKNIEHNLLIHGEAQGYPKTHEAFMKLVTQEWGMQLPPLREGYEYWYDAKARKIMKRPTP